MSSERHGLRLHVWCFFDEVDAVGAARDSSEGGGGVGARVLAQLLAEMDGVTAAGGARRHVVVLAATNRPHILDPALLRPGRFDRLVHVPLPDEAARTEIFRSQLARMRVQAGGNESQAAGPEGKGLSLDPASLASRTEGCSGAEVVAVCREAAMLAIREALESTVAGANCTEDATRSDPGEDSLPCARPEHFERALSDVRPRIDPATVRFYEEFDKKTRHAVTG